MTELPGPVIVWEVTPRCDIRCPYCYNVWNAPDSEEPVEAELPELLQVALLLTEIGAASVILTGGEPLLREDLEELVLALARTGLTVGVATNGRLLDSKRAAGLVRAGVRWFDIGLPAVDEEGYLEVTGSNGSESVRRALIAVKRAGARLNVAQVLTRSSIRHTVDVIELAGAIGADAVILNRFVPGGRGLEHAAGFAPTREELRRTLSSAGAAALRVGIPVCTGIPVEDCIHPHDLFPGISFGRCVCGDGKWAVGPNGSLRVCEQSPDILGSLREDSFASLISSAAVKRFRRDDRMDICDCRTCYSSCGGGCRFLPRAGV